MTGSITGLVLETYYYYRLVGMSPLGPAFGQTQTFRTSGAILGLQTLPPTNVQTTSVTFNGTFNPDGVDTHYYFEYFELICKAGCSAGPQETIPLPPGADAGAGTTPVVVSEILTGLKPGTRYEYRIVASSSLGTNYAEFVPFETSAAAPDPKVVAAEQVHTETAVVHAVINPGNGATSYHVEYGPSDCATSTCTSTPEVSIGGGVADLSAKVELSGLTPNTQYHYRVVAKNDTATVASPDQTFTTFPTTPARSTRAPTPTCASRPAPRCCPTAAAQGRR